MTRILVLDDESPLVPALQVNLQARRYQVDTAPHGAAALHLAAHKHPDLIVLDLGPPDLDGADVVRGLRGWTDTPIIVLSGRADSRDTVAALDAGADDYLTKPFDVDELLARIRAVTRRGRTPTRSTVTVTLGPYTVDLADRAITDGETDVRLSPTEWRLLEHLLRHPGKLLTQHALLTDVWGPEYATESTYLRQYIARLRRKLEADPARPRHLITEPGMGYRFRP